MHVPKDVLDLDYTIWKKIMSTNVDGTFLPIKEVIPGMIKRKFGRIVCISSIAGLGKRPNMIAYGTSKALEVPYAIILGRFPKPAIEDIHTILPNFLLIIPGITSLIGKNVPSTFVDIIFFHIV